jgi:hypothetical protein
VNSVELINSSIKSGQAAPRFESLRQSHIDWLIAQGVPAIAIVMPYAVEIARGIRAADGIFEHDPLGTLWFVFNEPDDTICWDPKTGEVATDLGRAFALGQDEIANPGATSLGRWFHIHESPLDWLRAARQGIVVLRWEWAFEQLRDVERIAVPEGLVTRYQKSMKPKLPDVGVIPKAVSA